MELYAVNNERVNVSNEKDVKEFVRLDKKKISKGHLKGSEVKRYVRIKTRLMKKGVIRVISRKTLVNQTREMYNSYPWWKKLSLRIKYYVMRIRLFFSSFRKKKG